MSGSKDILIEQLRERAEKAERFNAYLLGETVYAQMQNEEETGDKIAEEIVEMLMETLIEPWLGLNKEQIERCRVIIPERLPRAILWMGQLNRRLAVEEEEKKKLEAERDAARAELAEAAGHRCAYAQGAHGVAGCGKCFDCVKSENVKLRAALAAKTLRAETAVSIRDMARMALHLEKDENPWSEWNEALADLDRCYPPEGD